MAVITFPTALESYVAQQAIGQRRFDTFDTSDVTGAVDVVIGGPPRWTQQLQALDGMELAIAGQWDALMLQLRGGVNHLAMHDLLRPLPAGTMRGSPTLSATLAAGATTAAMTGAGGVNLLSGSSFEFDSNADGLSDGWTGYQAGSVGAVTYGRTTFIPQDGTFEQFIDAASLGILATDAAGIFRSVEFASDPGVLTASVRARSQGGPVRAYLDLRFETTAGVVLGNQTFGDLDPGFPGVRIGGSVLAPTGTRRVVIALFMASRSGANTSRQIAWDAVSLGYGTLPLDYLGRPSLQAGDWIQVGSGVGSHYAKVVTPVTFNDAGAGSVTFEPPTRQSYASGTAVTIEKARGHYKRANSTAGWANVPGALMSGGHALELVEQWT